VTGERIPALYSRLGFVDMRITKDTLIVDRDRGKGLVEIGVEEGPRYRIGSFEVAGNRRFSTETSMLKATIVICSRRHRSADISTRKWMMRSKVNDMTIFLSIRERQPARFSAGGEAGEIRRLSA
jgi:hypothetical protein